MTYFSKILKKYALGFGITLGLTLLAIATLLLVYAPDQTSYVVTIAGLSCSCVSMILISVDVLKNKQGVKE